MLIEDRVGPSFADIRPLKAATCEHFPVHHDLVDRLVAVDQHSDELVARVCAVSAAYAYADADTVALMMARIGLPGSAVRRVAMAVDPMFIASTAYLVQSADGRVVLLVYCGTEPTTLINWLTDADIHPDRIAGRVRREAVPAAAPPAVPLPPGRSPAPSLRRGADPAGRAERVRRRPHRPGPARWRRSGCRARRGRVAPEVHAAA